MKHTGLLIWKFSQSDSVFNHICFGSKQSTGRAVAWRFHTLAVRLLFSCSPVSPLPLSSAAETGLLPIPTAEGMSRGCQQSSWCHFVPLPWNRSFDHWPAGSIALKRALISNWYFGVAPLARAGVLQAFCRISSFLLPLSGMGNRRCCLNTGKHFCVSAAAPVQAAQKLWSFLLGDSQKPPWCGAGHPALGVPAGAVLGWWPCQPQPVCNSVILSCGTHRMWCCSFQWGQALW